VVGLGVGTFVPERVVGRALLFVLEGFLEGFAEVLAVGSGEGTPVATSEGLTVGFVGLAVGLCEGLNVGSLEGLNVGSLEGLKLGVAEGFPVGSGEGSTVGFAEGVLVGFAEGCPVGTAEGSVVSQCWSKVGMHESGSLGPIESVGGPDCAYGGAIFGWIVFRIGMICLLGGFSIFGSRDGFRVMDGSKLGKFSPSADEMATQKIKQSIVNFKNSPINFPNQLECC
jgi:hypothetical protein